VFLAKTTVTTLTVPDRIHPGEYMDVGDLKLGINLRDEHSQWFHSEEATERLVLA